MIGYITFITTPHSVTAFQWAQKTAKEVQLIKPLAPNIRQAH